jgi:NAD-dependent dihydropyrimidine dehydrogenase PreA subunit
MFGLRYLENVTTLQLDTDKCDGCKMCLRVCPHSVLVVENKKARIIDKGACMECGACAMNCPPQAITVDSGVGCAYGVIIGKIRGIEPTCECGTDGSSSCCG